MALDIAKYSAGIIYVGNPPASVSPASRDCIIIFNESNPIDDWQIIPFKQYLAAGGKREDIHYAAELKGNGDKLSVMLSSRKKLY